MYAKAKRTQLSIWKHHHSTEVSYVESVWCIITVSWKFRLIHRFCNLKCCWSALSQVFGACNADVLSGLVIINSIMQCLLYWTPANVHRLIPRISRPRSRDCTYCLPGGNLHHFLHSNVVYLCSFLAIVSFSDLLLLQNTHNCKVNPVATQYC